MSIQVGALYKFPNEFVNGPEWIYAFPIGKTGNLFSKYNKNEIVYIQYLRLGEDMLGEGCYAQSEHHANNIWVRVS